MTTGNRTKHTPGPWNAKRPLRENGGGVYYNDPDVYPQPMLARTLYGSHLSKETAEANAERIVACVNACESGGSVAQLLEAARAVQWVTPDGADESRCPDCLQWQPSGHTTYCNLAIAIAAVEREVAR